MKPLALIAAIGRDGVIGAKGAKLGLPWHLPEDLKRFRSLTTGHAIIMGRTTHLAIGRALPKRRNIVLSRSDDPPFEGAELAPDLESALALVQDDPLPFVIGGGSVYALALPFCTELHITEVDRATEGDVYFPEVDWSRFRERERVRGDTEGVTFVTWERID